MGERSSRVGFEKEAEWIESFFTGVLDKHTTMIGVTARFKRKVLDRHTTQIGVTARFKSG